MVKTGKIQKKRRIEKILRYGIIFFILFIFLFPFYWTIATSLKTRVVAWSMPPVFWFKPGFHNYWKVLVERNFLHFIKNSFIVAIGSTALALLIGTPAAFAFTRLKGTTIYRNIFVLILGGYLVPAMVVAVPLYIIASKVGFAGSYFVIILAHTLFNLAFLIWLLRGFFDGIPSDLEEAAILDGCSYFGALVRVIIPIATPGLIAGVTLTFILSWNDFLYGLVLTTLDTRTVPVAISQFLTPHAVIWGEITAVGTLSVIPVVIFSIILQKWVIRGLTLGAVKY